MDEIKGQALMFFDAGYETTATTLAWLTYELAVNPDVQEKVHDEILSVVGRNVRSKGGGFGLSWIVLRQASSMYVRPEAEVSPQVFL